MAAISGERANDERVKCLRIFADGNGETHMEDIDITCVFRKTFRRRGTISATSLRAWGKWIGTIRRSDCLCSG